MSDEIRILDLLAKYGKGSLYGDAKDWESLKKREREVEDFKLFCSRRTSPENYILMFGEREQWPEDTDWSKVEKLFETLYGEYYETQGSED